MCFNLFSPPTDNHVISTNSPSSSASTKHARKAYARYAVINDVNMANNSNAKNKKSWASFNPRLHSARSKAQSLKLTKCNPTCKIHRVMIPINHLPSLIFLMDRANTTA